MKSVKKLVLILAIAFSVAAVRAQSLTWTTWHAYLDSTNTPDLYFHFTNDSVQFSSDNVTWTTIGGYSYTPNTYRMIDDPAFGCTNITDTGVYTTVFSGDTMWLLPQNDPCFDRLGYLAYHYYVRLNTGVDEMSVPDFSVSPNPSSGIFTVQSLTLPEKIRVTTIDGKVVSEQQANSSTFSVDLTTYPTGIYFLSIVYADHATTKRIVKE